MVKVKAGVGLDRGVAHTAFTVVLVGSEEEEALLGRLRNVLSR